MYFILITLYLFLSAFSLEKECSLEIDSCELVDIVQSDRPSSRQFYNYGTEFGSIIKKSIKEDYGFTGTLMFVLEYDLKEKGDLSLHYDGIFRFYDDSDTLVNKSLVEKQLIEKLVELLPFFSDLIDKNKFDDHCSVLIYKQSFCYY